jgi:hypothetical protein
VNYRWLLRASGWARNPPSAKKVRFVFGVILLCLALWGIEAIWGWPEALTPSGGPRGRITY